MRTIDTAHRGGFDAYYRHSTPHTSAPGILRRVFEAIRRSRERHANRDIEDFVARSGGRLTDGMEREMSDRFLTGRAHFHR
jgi:hypothetical protein